jgi:hypothetical protein
LAVVVLPLVPGFALIGLVVVVLAAVAAVAALAAAILAMPYLLVRSLRRRLAGRHRSTGGSRPVATAIARATTPPRRPTGPNGSRLTSGGARRPVSRIATPATLASVSVCRVIRPTASQTIRAVEVELDAPH